MIVLGNPVTGVDIQTVDEGDAEIELYDMNGRRVSGRPAPGHYIMVRRSADGTAASEHLIVK